MVTFFRYLFFSHEYLLTQIKLQEKPTYLALPLFLTLHVFLSLKMAPFQETRFFCQKKNARKQSYQLMRNYVEMSQVIGVYIPTYDIMHRNTNLQEIEICGNYHQLP